MKNKKAELPFWMIITLVIALIAIFVFIIFFSRSAGTYTESTSSCELQGGTCKSTCQDSEYVNRIADCPQQGFLCCVDLG